MILLGIAVTSVYAAPTNVFIERQTERVAMTGNAASIADESASSGGAIKFGQAAFSCPGEPNKPGGEDPWGGCWPGAHNTGVPQGLPGDTRTPVTLTPYTGSCNLNVNNTVIDSKEITCERVRITAQNVEIKNSKINGRIETPDPYLPQYQFFTLTDSEVAVGEILGDKGVKLGNFVITRANINGSTNNITCYINCTVIDSWTHGQTADPEGILHISSIRQGENGIFRHNTIICEAARGQGAGGACSAALSGYGDFAPVQNNLIERNLILAGTLVIVPSQAVGQMTGSPTRGSITTSGLSKTCSKEASVDGVVLMDQLEDGSRYVLAMSGRAIPI